MKEPITIIMSLFACRYETALPLVLTVLAAKRALGVDGVWCSEATLVNPDRRRRLTCKWRFHKRMHGCKLHVQHVRPHAVFTPDCFSTSLKKGIGDLGHCITVAVSRNCSDLRIKNTFALKPLDGLLCAELSYNHGLSAPQGAAETAIFNLTCELFFRDFTVAVKSLNSEVGKSERSTKAVEF